MNYLPRRSTLSQNDGTQSLRGNTSYKEATSMNSPSKTIIGPEEEVTQPKSKLAMNSKEVKTWVIDD